MDTIAAIATPPGEGAVAIIRISGPQALVVAERLFSKPIQSLACRTVTCGKILDATGTSLDQVLLLVMRAPRSYTGEDTVEIFCHGGSLISRQILEQTLHVGARAANPGEFTYRAFRNGKIDLAQAEAVQQLIGAKNTLALQAAGEQLNGALSKKIGSLQQELIDVAAILEAWVDFPEEDLAFASFDEVTHLLEKILEKLQHLLATFHEGKLVHEGLSLCLVGPPNAGKSSLMNALLGKERAIVTPIAGTTRDLLEETLRLGQLHLRLIDTAGIRVAHELIEQEGIRRSYAAMEGADLVLLVLDASKTLDDEEKNLLQKIPPNKSLLIWNKIDLPTQILPLDICPQVHISAKEGIGLEELKQQITALIWKKGAPAKEEVLLTSVRHKEAIADACKYLTHVIQGLRESVSAEFVSSDMRETLRCLGRIVGRDISEDILSSIFAKFCVGK
jgi:tRNA modification GTPase